MADGKTLNVDIEDAGTLLLSTRTHARIATASPGQHMFASYLLLLQRLETYLSTGQVKAIQYCVFAGVNAGV